MRCLIWILSAVFDHALLLKCISRILLPQVLDKKKKKKGSLSAGIIIRRVIEGGMQICTGCSPSLFPNLSSQGCQGMQLVLT